MKVLSSREFNQDVSRAKRDSRLAPVLITDRGRPTHVLLSIDAYRRLSGQAESIVDLLAMADPPELPPADPGHAAGGWPRRAPRR